MTPEQKRTEVACEAFYPAWAWITLNDPEMAADVRSRMGCALVAVGAAPRPTARHLADAIAPGGPACAKCGSSLPAGASCRSFDCPLNPSAPLQAPAPRGFVAVMPPQGGVGATQRLW